LDVYRQISLDPFTNPFVEDLNAQYLMTSWLGNFIAFALKVDDFAIFFLLHLVFSISFLIVMLGHVRKVLEFRSARKATLVFLSLPVAATSFYWVGMDSLTLLLFALVVKLSNNSVWPIFFGCMIGLQHFEQGVFAVVISLAGAAVLSFSDKPKAKWIFTVSLKTLVGIVIGKVILQIIFASNSITLESDRTTLWLNNLSGLFNLFRDNWNEIAWSLLLPGWVIIGAAYFFRLGERHSYIAVLALGWMTSALVFDQTRVGVIVTYFYFALSLFKSQEIFERLHPRFFSIYVGLWMVIPWQWIFGGVTKESLFIYDILWLIRMTAALFHVDVPAPVPFF
jgi:hypothetical protein